MWGGPPTSRLDLRASVPVLRRVLRTQSERLGGKVFALPMALRRPTNVLMVSPCKREGGGIRSVQNLE